MTKLKGFIPALLMALASCGNNESGSSKNGDSSADAKKTIPQYIEDLSKAAKQYPDSTGLH